MRSAVTALLLLAICTVAAAQSPFELKGDEALDQFELEDALYFYQMAWEEDDANPAVSRKIALTFRKIGALEESAEWFGKTLELDASYPEDMLYFAEALKFLERYEEAMIWYKKYLYKQPTDSRAKSHVANPRYYRELQSDSMRYEWKKLQVNTDRPAFGVCRMDDRMLFSAASVPEALSADGKTGEDDPFLDVYVARVDDSRELVEVENLQGEVNSRYHDGPVAYDPVHREILITRNNMKKGRVVRDSKGNVNLKIYASVNAGGEWLKAVELPFNSDAYSTGHPTVSLDGERMYFVSNMEGGYGGTDIYVAHREGDSWGTPENLGSDINTEGDEMFPFVAADGALFFASNGHAGLGGLDIFTSSFDGRYWQKPKNLGAPINSNHDDFSLYFEAETEDGYFTSNRGGQGSDDIFYFQTITLTETILAGMISTPSPDKSLAGEQIRIVHGSAEDLAVLDAKEAFEFTAQAGEHVEIFMVSDAFEETPLLVFDVPEDLESAFTYVGEINAFMKQVKQIDPNVLVLINDPRFQHVDQEELESDSGLLDELLKLKDEMDALEDDPLRKAEIFAEDLSSLEISGIGDYRKVGVSGQLTSSSEVDWTQATVVVDFPASAWSDTLTLDADGRFALEVLPGERFALRTDAAGQPWDRAVVETQLVTRNYAYHVDLGPLQVGPDAHLGDPVAEGEGSASGFAPMEVTGILRSARAGLDLATAEVMLISGDHSQPVVLNETGAFTAAIQPGTTFHLDVRQPLDSLSETVWMQTFQPRNAMTRLDLGTLVITDKDARESAMAATPMEMGEEVLLRVDPEAFADVATADEFGIASIYFDTNEERIRTADVTTLNEAVEVLKANPDWYLEIHAFTDPRGSSAYNWKLSERRALSVQRYMALHGVDGRRLMVDWHGEKNQIALSDAQRAAGIDQNQLNRRAEFHFVVKR